MSVSKQELNGKRLLLLGGRLWKETIREFCSENNIRIITAGNRPGSDLNKIADEYYNVNTTDPSAMKQLIQDKKIDGVYLGGNETVIGAAVKYVNELSMPCYCDSRQWNMLQNKRNLKRLFMENDLPVVPEYDYDRIMTDEGFNDYPVVTKPADGSGSEGFSVCHNRSEFEKGYQHAADNSLTGNVIIEKFVKNTSVVVFYTFSNGDLYFSGIEDKYPVRYEQQGSYVAGMHLFQSRTVDDFRSKYEHKLKTMFSSIGLREGTVWMEVFYDSGCYYFNEAGYRYSGSVSPYPIEYLFGYNQIASDICYSLTGKSDLLVSSSSLIQRVEKKGHYAIYSIHIKPGRIVQTEGFDELLKKPNVVAVPVTKNRGETVESSGSIGQVYAFVHFTYDDEEELREMLKGIQDSLVVKDEQGENMICKMIDLDTLVIR